MNRREFFAALAILPLTGKAMKLNDLNTLTADWKGEARMPVLFLGHGSPMNAIEENAFVQGFRKTAKQLPKPRAIVCVSAHWETRGTKVTAMEQPRTIHDFGGFPKALFEVQYPAPGSPALAKETAALAKSTTIEMDEHWGLDHGAWSVIKHLFPAADVPVIQLSLDRNLSPAAHYRLASELAALRERGVLVVGSGNMVHNLRMVAWDKLQVPGYGYDWAIEANESMKKHLRSGNHQALIDFNKQGQAWNLAIPTPEHFLPLLYTLGMARSHEPLHLFNDETLGGSLSMTSVMVG